MTGMPGRPSLLQQGVIVRDARPDELALIGDLRIAAYRADGFVSATSEYIPTLRALGADGEGEVLAAVDNGQVVGTVMLQHWPHAGEVVRGPGEAEIRALAVRPEARGRGIGDALLTAVTDLAVRRGVRHLVLFTLPDMSVAQHMYTKAAFRRLPDRDLSLAPGLVLLAFGKILDEPSIPAGDVRTRDFRSG
jgi:ribosomal protein S18 acetylase RimI-like enzyme